MHRSHGFLLLLSFFLPIVFALPVADEQGVTVKQAKDVAQCLLEQGKSLEFLQNATKKLTEQSIMTDEEECAISCVMKGMQIVSTSGINKENLHTFLSANSPPDRILLVEECIEKVKEESDTICEQWKIIKMCSYEMDI